jgi:hypothetical protein
MLIARRSVRPTDGELSVRSNPPAPTQQTPSLLNPLPSGVQTLHTRSPRQHQGSPNSLVRFSSFEADKCRRWRLVITPPLLELRRIAVSFKSSVFACLPQGYITVNMDTHPKSDTDTDATAVSKKLPKDFIWGFATGASHLRIRLYEPILTSLPT